MSPIIKGFQVRFVAGASLLRLEAPDGEVSTRFTSSQGRS